MKTMLMILMFLLSFYQVSHAGLFDFDPPEKLKEAKYMVSIGRPIAADKLINDVIVYCKKKNDEVCLATAYFYYGQALMARLPEEYDRQKNANRSISAYVDEGVTVGNGDQKAMEYLDKALTLAKKHKVYDVASAICIRMGILQYTRFKDRTAACDSFDRSLEYYLRFKKDNPDATVTIPKGFDSFEEYIAQAKSETECQK